MNEQEKQIEQFLKDLGYTDIHHPAWIGEKDGITCIAYWSEDGNFVITPLKKGEKVLHKTIYVDGRTGLIEIENEQGEKMDRALVIMKRIIGMKKGRYHPSTEALMECAEQRIEQIIADLQQENTELKEKLKLLGGQNE